MLRLGAEAIYLPRVRSEPHMGEAAVTHVVRGHVGRVGALAICGGDGLGPLVRAPGARLGSNQSSGTSRCLRWIIYDAV